LAISHEPKVLIDAIGKFGLRLLTITSRMLSILSKVYLRRTEKGMY
jgi:hypothetical protein